MANPWDVFSPDMPEWLQVLHNSDREREGKNPLAIVANESKKGATWTSAGGIIVDNDRYVNDLQYRADFKKAEKERITAALTKAKTSGELVKDRNEWWYGGELIVRDGLPVGNSKVVQNAVQQVRQEQYGGNNFVEVPNLVPVPIEYNGEKFYWDNTTQDVKTENLGQMMNMAVGVMIIFSFLSLFKK